MSTEERKDSPYDCALIGRNRAEGTEPTQSSIEYRSEADKRLRKDGLVGKVRSSYEACAQEVCVRATRRQLVYSE